MWTGSISKEELDKTFEELRRRCEERYLVALDAIKAYDSKRRLLEMAEQTGNIIYRSC